jgi:hypothetical protein
MKWDKPNGATQHTVDRRYCIVEAVKGTWIAYALGPTTGDEIGPADTEERARALCERRERENSETRRRA